MIRTPAIVTACFVLFCGLLVAFSGLFRPAHRGDGPCILLQQTGPAVAPAAAEQSSIQEQSSPGLSAAGGRRPAAVTLGSTDPNNGYKLAIMLSSKGAGIAAATFSEYKDRSRTDPKPLVLLRRSRTAVGSEILPLATGNLAFPDRNVQLPLGLLDWKSLPPQTSGDGWQTAAFEAVVEDAASGEVIRLTKTYRLPPDRYELHIDFAMRNISGQPLRIAASMTGPAGVAREASRADMRKALAAFRDPDGGIVTASVDASKLAKGKNRGGTSLQKPGLQMLWIAVVNKYFASILAQAPEDGLFDERTADNTAVYIDPDGTEDSGDETLGVMLKLAPVELAAGGERASVEYKMQLYLGPKDKELFDKNPGYRELGFVHTITFMPCFCCPAAVINPLAFGILAAMKWMYGFLPNYGVVIIILVFLVRLAMHPVTKKSQVAMSKFSKLAPQAEQIKQKYAHNKTELNKQLMNLYRQQGASPVMGFLPMLIQMPIWIALYSAIYASIELRAAPFLPFWITDLSAPDALVSFATVEIPLLKWKFDSLNLLPLLMGVAMYLQQKMMPKTAAAASGQAAQQQKMMMVMMTLMFPLFLYKAPSGLNLYIMASTFAGVIEQHVIRRHIEQKELWESQNQVAATSKTGGKVKKKKPKPFFKTMRS